jgi:hypothetical protein
MAAGLGSIAEALAASDAPSGNAAAIAFYERSAAATSAYQEIDFRGAGTSYEVRPNSHPTLFALGSTPAGFKRASDDVKLIQRHGVVVEEVDRFSTPGEPSLSVWKEGPHKWVGQLQRPGACASAVTAAGAADFATIGQPFVEPEGSTFAALKRVAGETTVVSTYADEGATAHETDTINATSGLWISSSVIYRGGPFDGNATSMSTFRYKHTAPVIAIPPAGRCR